MTPAPYRVVVVGCSKSKVDTDTLVAARDLYQPSDLFRRRRAYAEAQGCPWYILSAAHGLISPTAKLLPYNTTMADVRRSDDRHALKRWAGTTLARVIKHAPAGVPIILEVHAGRDYVTPLRECIEAQLAEAGHASSSWRVQGTERITIVTPLEGLGIGQQKHWYAIQQAAPAAEAAEVAEVEPSPAPAPADELEPTEAPLLDEQNVLTPEGSGSGARLGGGGAATEVFGPCGSGRCGHDHGGKPPDAYAEMGRRLRAIRQAPL